MLSSSSFILSPFFSFQFCRTTKKKYQLGSDAIFKLRRRDIQTKNTRKFKYDTVVLVQMHVIVYSSFDDEGRWCLFWLFVCEKKQHDGGGKCAHVCNSVSLFHLNSVCLEVMMLRWRYCVFSLCPRIVVTKKNPARGFLCFFLFFIYF